MASFPSEPGKLPTLICKPEEKDRKFTAAAIKALDRNTETRLQTQSQYVLSCCKKGFISRNTSPHCIYAGRQYTQNRAITGDLNSEKNQLVQN